MPTIDERDGLFDGCQSLAEIIIVVRHLLGDGSVETLLQQLAPQSTRQGIRNAALELCHVGLADLGATVRRHARRAPIAPPTFSERVAARKQPD